MTLSLSHTHTHSLSISLSYTRTLTHTLHQEIHRADTDSTCWDRSEMTRCLSLSSSLSLSLSLSLSQVLSLTHTLTHMHFVRKYAEAQRWCYMCLDPPRLTHPLSLSLSLNVTILLSLSHTHTHLIRVYTVDVSISLSLSHTHTHFIRVSPVDIEAMQRKPQSGSTLVVYVFGSFKIDPSSLSLSLAQSFPLTHSHAHIHFTGKYAELMQTKPQTGSTLVSYMFRSFQIDSRALSHTFSLPISLSLTLTHTLYRKIC